MQLHTDHRGLPPDLGEMVGILGNFDGVHRGHQAVIAQGRALADRMGRPLMLVTFEPHPRRFFAPDAPPFRLTSLHAKARLMAALGVDHLVILPFTADFAALTAQAFVDEVLIGGLRLGHVLVGHDFRFGRGRMGDAEFLARAGAAQGLGVTVIDAVGQDGTVFSSTGIRALLAEGAVEEAAERLGHWWEIEGAVIAGDARGRGLGYPTANLDLDDYLRPRRGVYGLWVKIAGASAWHLAAANFGVRPTFAGLDERLEIHLLDAGAPDLYGQVLRAAFFHFVRPERTFASPDALVAQIAQDVAAIKARALDPRASFDRFPLFAKADEMAGRIAAPAQHR